MGCGCANAGLAVPRAWRWRWGCDGAAELGRWVGCVRCGEVGMVVNIGTGTNCNGTKLHNRHFQDLYAWRSGSRKVNEHMILSQNKTPRCPI